MIGRLRRTSIAIAVLAAVVLFAPQSGRSAETQGPTSDPVIGDPSENLFLNPGFENGSEPWTALNPNAAFQRVEGEAHSGNASALLKMRDDDSVTGAKPYYLVQELAPPKEFPELLGGYYKVDHWLRGTPKQYIQVVIIAFNVKNLPPGDFPNHQIRYVLSGITQQPFEIRNGRFVFLGGAEPKTGEWIRFEMPVGDDFRRLWGDIPRQYDKIRVLFEVRFDDKKRGISEADVYYDDLYLGPRRNTP